MNFTWARVTGSTIKKGYAMQETAFTPAIGAVAAVFLSPFFQNHAAA